MNSSLKQDIENIVCEGCNPNVYPDYVTSDAQGTYATMCDHCEVPKLINALLEAADKTKEKWHNFK